MWHRGTGTKANAAMHTLTFYHATAVYRLTTLTSTMACTGFYVCMKCVYVVLYGISTC